MTSAKQTRLLVRNSPKLKHMRGVRSDDNNALPVFRQLMVAQFNDADRKAIAKGLVLATTPKHALKLLPGANDAQLPQAKRSKWTMPAVAIGPGNTVRILKYKGLEVAVYFERSTSVVIPEPEDPVPEGVLEDDDDVWVRLDLFSKSPRQLVGAVREEIQAKDDRIFQLELEVESLHRVHTADERHIKSLQTQITNLQPATKKSSRKK